MQKATSPQETLPHWYLILAAISCTFTILLILYLSLRSKLQCLHRVVYTQISPRKTLHPNPQLLPLLHQSIRQPQFIRTNIATASLSLHMHCHVKTRQLGFQTQRRAALIQLADSTKYEATKFHLASSRHVEVAGSARNSPSPVFRPQHTSFEKRITTILFYIV